MANRYTAQQFIDKIPGSAGIVSDLYYGIKRMAASDGEAHAESEGGTWNIVAETPRAVA